MTTPKDNALHLMEGQGWLPIDTAPKDGSTITLGYMEDGVIAQQAEMQWSHIQRNGFLPGVVGMWVCPGGNFTWNPDGEFAPSHWKPVAPKTALQHFADEVEASGEAAKHAMSDALLSVGLMALLECAASDLESYSPILLEGYEADVRRVHEATSMGLRAELAATNYELNKFKELYRLSQEGLVRERGITKELAAALEPLLEVYTRMLHFKGYTEGAIEEMPRFIAARAALSKVQHVAARGAEVSE